MSIGIPSVFQMWLKLAKRLKRMKHRGVKKIRINTFYLFFLPSALKIYFGYFIVNVLLNAKTVSSLQLVNSCHLLHFYGYSFVCAAFALADVFPVANDKK